VLRSTRIAVAMLVLALAYSGCAWVALTPDAANVQLGSTDRLDGCELVGTTKARTKSKVGIFARSEEKVAEELATLARNDAPELGGNTVIAEGPVSNEGTQRFSIYSCPEQTEASP
jgi:hypothetical protein